MNKAKADLLDHFQSPRLGFDEPDGGPRGHAPAELAGDERYQRLRRRLKEAGFFAPDPWNYAIRGGLSLLFTLGSFAVLLTQPSWPARIACFVLAGFGLVQGTFVSHEAKHGSVFRRPALNEAVGQLFNSFLVGFSFSYFGRGHDLHHLHCNEADVDPDTLSTLFSVFPSEAAKKRGLGFVISRFQGFFIPVLYPTWTLAMKWDGLTYVARNLRKTRADQLAMALHLLFWFALQAIWLPLPTVIVNYLGWSAFAGIYLAIAIPPNHVARPVVHDGAAVDFVTQQIVTTRNLPSSPFIDYLMMNVNNHIEHHLFPWAPGGRLRRGRAIVRAFCAEEGLPYHERGFFAGLAEVMVHLARMAKFTGKPVVRDASAGPRPAVDGMPELDKRRPDRVEPAALAS